MKIETLSPDQSYSVWGLPGTLIWGFTIVVAFILTHSFVMGLYIGINYGNVASSEFESLMIELQDNGLVLSLSTFASLFVCGLLMLGIIKLKKNSNLKHYLGLRAVGLRTVKHWLLVIICLIVVSDLLTLLLGRPIVPEFMTTIYKSTEPIWVLWLALIIAAPLFEELFFRGFLISGFSSTIVGPIGAIAISAALWAAIHLQYELYIIGLIFILGVVLGIARLKSGSVLLTIGLHSFVNLVATIEVVIYLS